MSVTRPEGWKPPAKNHGGEDIPEFFSLMLENSALAMICARSHNLYPPITTDFNQVIGNPEEAIDQRLRVRGRYFYQPSGSIFMDFKIMRSEAERKIGRDLGEADPTQAAIKGYREMMKPFTKEMSTREALALARTIVATSDWEEVS